MRLIIGFAALSLIASPASAQHPLVLQKLNELNASAPRPASAELQAAGAGTANAYAAANATCAPTSLTLGDIVPITGAGGILQSVLSGKLKNAWTLYAKHNGCPGNASVRYMVLQSPDGSLRALQVNQGPTLTNPSIMRDTSSLAALAALAGAQKLDATCKGKDMAMGSTRITARSKDLDAEQFGVHYTGSWSEIWQFKTCGKAFDVPVDFRADGDGGAYTDVKINEVTPATAKVR